MIQVGSILTDSFFRSSTNTVMTGYEIVQQGLLEMEELQRGSRFEWFKIFVPALELLRKIFASPRFDVFVYVVKSMDKKNNEFIGSRNVIAKETGVSPKTVERTIAEMEKLDVIRRVKRSIWMLNPQVALSGRKWKETALLRRYEGYAVIDNPTFDNFIDSGIDYEQFLEEGSDL